MAFRRGPARTQTRYHVAGAAAGREWSDNEQQMVREGLADAAGVALYPTGMRAFLPLGSEQTVMPRLLALAFAASFGDHVTQVQRC